MATRKRRRASLKKETIRRLDPQELSREDLAEVAGGAVNNSPFIVAKQPYTTQCITMC